MLFFFFTDCAMTVREQFCILQCFAPPTPLPPPESQVTSVTAPALCPWAGCGEHKQGIPLQRQPAGQLVDFSTPPCVEGHRRMLLPFENVPIYVVLFFFTISKTKKKTNSFSVLDRPCSVWVVFKTSLTSYCLREEGRMIFVEQQFYLSAHTISPWACLWAPLRSTTLHIFITFQAAQGGQWSLYFSEVGVGDKAERATHASSCVWV